MEEDELDQDIKSKNNNVTFSLKNEYTEKKNINMKNLTYFGAKIVNINSTGNVEILFDEQMNVNFTGSLNSS